MKRLGIFGLLFALAAPCAPAVTPPSHFGFDEVSSIAILEGGRYKPLESYAGKAVETITGRWTFKGVDPVAYLVSMVAFPDEWIEKDIILLDYQPLKEMMGLEPSQRHFSYQTLMGNPQLEKLHQRIGQKMQTNQDLSQLENKVGELLHRIQLLRSILSGEAIALVPPGPGEDPLDAWTPVTQISATVYPADKQAEVLNAYNELVAAVRSSDAEGFEQAGGELKAALASLNPAVYPSETSIRREITYNATRPFMTSWILFALAFVAFLISFQFPSRWVNWTACALFGGGYLMSTYGLIVRSIISGRAPVSNMYESVVYVGWAVLTFALIFELVYRQRWFLTVASALGVGILVMGDLMPFDANIEPLVPVLRSNYWLIIHVMTITASYGAFALAMGLAHVVLGMYFFRSRNQALMRTISNFIYRVLQVGTVLLAAGTILGGVWAADSWGRFWGWDPKETWALISLLGYMAILHARFAGLLRMLGVAVCSIFGFWLIIMTWYGVNFVLGKGLHSYGFGSGGGWYVTGFLIFETLYVAAFAIRYYSAAEPAKPAPATGDSKDALPV